MQHTFYSNYFLCTIGYFILLNALCFNTILFSHAQDSMNELVEISYKLDTKLMTKEEKNKTSSIEQIKQSILPKVTESLIGSLTQPQQSTTNNKKTSSIDKDLHIEKKLLKRISNFHTHNQIQINTISAIQLQPYYVKQMISQSTASQPLNKPLDLSKKSSMSIMSIYGNYLTSTKSELGHAQFIEKEKRLFEFEPTAENTYYIKTHTGKFIQSNKSLSDTAKPCVLASHNNYVGHLFYSIQCNDLYLHIQPNGEISFENKRTTSSSFYLIPNSIQQEQYNIISNKFDSYLVADMQKKQKNNVKMVRFKSITGGYLTYRQNKLMHGTNDLPVEQTFILTYKGNKMYTIAPLNSPSHFLSSEKKLNTPSNTAPTCTLLNLSNKYSAVAYNIRCENKYLNFLKDNKTTFSSKRDLRQSYYMEIIPKL